MTKSFVCLALALGLAAALLQACAGVPSSTAAPAAPATAPTSASAPAKSPPVVYQPLPDHKPVIYIIGDSTVKNGADNGGNGQWGWGHILHYYFDESKVTIVIDALGGTSSRSFFQTTNLWPRTLAKLQQGDYLFMQFGHNDDTRPPESDTLRYRSTIKSNGEETVQGPKDATTMETIHSFGWCERQMITQARAKKAIPVVCSLIPRNSWASSGKANRADPGYAGLAHAAADQAGAFFLPLNALIAEQYDKLGRAKVTADLFPPAESTHTTWAGAKLNAQCVAEGVKALTDCPLKDFLKTNPVVPDAPDVQAGAGRGARGGPAAAPATATAPG